MSGAATSGDTKDFPRVTEVPPTKTPVCSLTVETDHTTDGGHTYRVVTAKNTLLYEPGEVVAQAEMQMLCNDPSWDVYTMQPAGRAPYVGG